MVIGNMNILIVHNYYKLPGGEDTVVQNEKEMLEKRGNKVVLYTRHNNEIDSMNRMQKLLIPVNTIFSVQTYKEIKKLIKDNGINVVHVHNTLNMISPSVYYAAVSLGVPVVQTIHNFRMVCPGATLYRDGHICEDCVGNGLLCSVKHACYRNSKIQTLASAITQMIHRATGIYRKINYICLTGFNKEKLLSLKNIRKDRIFIKPNFANGSVKEIKASEKKKYYLFAGRLEKIKGIDVLLKAWKLLGEDAPELIICGSGELDKNCQSFVKNNSVKNVTFKGQTPHDELMKLMGEARALVFPSQWYEGFPMTITESYSLGTPVIAGDIGNPANLVFDGETGFKFKYDSADALAETIKKMNDLADNEYDRLCNNAYVRYNSSYTEEENYKRLMSIYKRISIK